MTLDTLPPELVRSLARLVPPARVLDERVYSPWLDPKLDAFLRAHAIDTVVVSGGETGVCVFATILGGVDRGHRVVIAQDALCCSADKTHDATMTLYGNRFGEQVETASTAEILEAWY